MLPPRMILAETIRVNNHNVLLGLRPNGNSWDNAINDGWEPNKNLFNIDEATHKVNLQSIFLYFIIIYRDIIKIE